MQGTAYLLLDKEGAPIGLAGTLDEALAEACRIDPQQRIYLDAPSPEDYELVAPEPESLAANVRNANAPQTALRAVRRALGRPEGPVIDFRAAMAMSLKEAHEQLAPFFPRNKYTKKTHARTSVRAYTTAIGTSAHKGMAYHILDQNYKTSKKTPKDIVATLFEKTRYRKANVLGLSLLPTTQSSKSPTVLSIIQDSPSLYGVPRPVEHGRVGVNGINVCTSASAECMSSCLVFSGHNLASDYNTVKKYALTESLVSRPEAFVRMLAENIRLHRDRSLQARTMPLVRLNVFSDLPWELMVPDLFTHFYDVQFYDYTKVPNRQPPPNYDLTFSFSGTAKNAAYIDDEIGRGSRVAVVFAATGLRLLYRARWKVGRKWEEFVGARPKAIEMAKAHGVEMEPLGRLEVPQSPSFYRQKIGAKTQTRHYATLPKDFLGLPLVDGDVSDMRPYDPAPCFVGLRWKNPVNQGVTVDEAEMFIVQVKLIPRAGGYYDAIVSKTPRFDNVDYFGTSPSETDE